jgi:hypothetical protein
LFSAIGAHLTDLKPFFEPLNDGQKGCDISRIAGPHLATDGLTLIIDHGTHNHLHEIRAMIVDIHLIRDRWRP